MEILFLRHGITDWNTRKILQGRTDIPLNDEGEKQVSLWRLPDGIESWYVSPLARARQTAGLLGLSDYSVCDELTEMNWGQWEGCSVEQLRAQDQQAMARYEARGLDLTPPGGESPRQVRERLRQWLVSLPSQRSVGVISHKGIIRAAISLATGWQMKSKPDVKLRANCGYLFDLTSGELGFVEEIDLCCQ